MLVEKAGAALDETGKDYANRINNSAQFMDGGVKSLGPVQSADHHLAHNSSGDSGRSSATPMLRGFRGVDRLCVILAASVTSRLTMTANK